MEKRLQEIQKLIDDLTQKRLKHTARQAFNLKEKILKTGKFNEKDQLDLDQMKLVSGIR